MAYQSCIMVCNTLEVLLYQMLALPVNAIKQCGATYCNGKQYVTQLYADANVRAPWNDSDKGSWLYFVEAASKLQHDQKVLGTMVAVCPQM